MQLAPGFGIRRASEWCVEAYRAIQNRISAVAQLYDVIARAAVFGPVDMPAYLDGIATSIDSSLTGEEAAIDIRVDAKPLRISADHSVPIELLYNKLATKP